MEDRGCQSSATYATRRRNGWWRALLLSSILHPLSSLFCAGALASEARQEEVFRSIQNSVRSGGTEDGGGGTIILLLAGAVGLLVLIASLRRRITGGPNERAYGGAAKPIKHGGKLLREVRKQVGLRSVELKQLKLLADGMATDDEPAPSPLTLLICPSVLVKAVERSRGAKIDREVIAGLVKRLKSTHVVEVE